MFKLKKIYMGIVVLFKVKYTKCLHFHLLVTRNAVTCLNVRTLRQNDVGEEWIEADEAGQLK